VRRWLVGEAMERSRLDQRGVAAMFASSPGGRRHLSIPRPGVAHGQRRRLSALSSYLVLLGTHSGSKRAPIAASFSRPFTQFNAGSANIDDLKPTVSSTQLMEAMCTAIVLPPARAELM
jgi:hypothetical protein